MRLLRLVVSGKLLIFLLLFQFCYIVRSKAAVKALMCKHLFTCLLKCYLCRIILFFTSTLVVVVCAMCLNA